MLGIKDPIILLAFLLCLISTVICVVYGAMKWNADGDEAESTDKDRQWDEEEKKIKEEL
jgi:hypothetical protein